jgi:hypothetical protein
MYAGIKVLGKFFEKVKEIEQKISIKIIWPITAMIFIS